MLDLDPVAIFVPRLHTLGGAWAITGSIASMTYGEIRSTNDIDVIVLLGETQIAALDDVFPAEDFYCPPRDVVRQEQRRSARGHVNIIHIASGFKADFYFTGADELSIWALRNRREAKSGNWQVWLTPPEYVIIRKLEFFREGGSEKHVRDIRGMLAVTDVDLALLRKEIERRGLAEQWERVRGDQPGGGG
jgi:hypothetical protein